MWHRNRHGKAQAFPLSVMEGSQKPDPRGLQEVGTVRDDFEEGMEVARRYCYASSQVKANGTGTTSV